MLHWLSHKLGLNACPRCETLVDYALEGLPEDQQTGVRKHLDDCPPCREQVRDFYQVREGLALCSKQVEAPQDFNSKVLARLKQAPPALPQERERAGGWPRFWMMAGPVFALMSVLMTLVAAGALLTRRPPVPANPLLTLSNAVLQDPRSAHVSLTALDAGSRAGGELVLCQGMDHAVLNCRNLKACEPGQSYGLWIAAPGQAPRRLARFLCDGSAACSQLLSLGADFQAQGKVTFMVKPESASQAGPEVLKGSVDL